MSLVRKNKRNFQIQKMQHIVNAKTRVEKINAIRSLGHEISVKANTARVDKKFGECLPVAVRFLDRLKEKNNRRNRRKRGK